MTYDEATALEAEKLAVVARGWNTADYLADDEIRALVAEQPPFRSEVHRLLSTILKLRGVVS